jgi:hypothetical protein
MVTRLDLRNAALDGLKLPLLFLNVYLDRIGNEVVCAPSGRLREAVELPFDRRS